MICDPPIEDQPSTPISCRGDISRRVSFCSRPHLLGQTPSPEGTRCHPHGWLQRLPSSEMELVALALRARTKYGVLCDQAGDFIYFLGKR